MNNIVDVHQTIAGESKREQPFALFFLIEGLCPAWGLAAGGNNTDRIDQEPFARSSCGTTNREEGDVARERIPGDQREQGRDDAAQAMGSHPGKITEGLLQLPDG